MKKWAKATAGRLVMGAACSMLLTGCGSSKTAGGKTQIEIVQYKPEAVKIVETLAEKFNAEHDDIELIIDSPNDAMAILKTRFIREDYPDIIGIGGDINYSGFLDSDMLMDISDYDGLADVKEAYLKTNKELELIPEDGVYALPYMANAAGVLYNKDIFDEHGWMVPTTWDEFTALCGEIQETGIWPLYFGFKDVWTCLAPWNAICVALAPADVANRVNRGETTFSEEYREVAERTKALLQWAEPDPYAYSYNDACTAFARGQSAMYIIGSYAIPQIRSVNPEMNMDSFVFPASNVAEENILNSGNDLMFCVMESCPNKEAAYEVLRFLQADENVQLYVTDQKAIPCKKGDFEMSGDLNGMRRYIDEGILADYPDHHYPAEMSVDAMIQTFLIDEAEDAADIFMERFDTEWKRYNRDRIARVQAYQKEQETKGGESK